MLNLNTTYPGGHMLTTQTLSHDSQLNLVLRDCLHFAKRHEAGLIRAGYAELSISILSGWVFDR